MIEIILRQFQQPRLKETKSGGGLRTAQGQEADKRKMAVLIYKINY